LTFSRLNGQSILLRIGRWSPQPFLSEVEQLASFLFVADFKLESVGLMLIRIRQDDNWIYWTLVTGDRGY